MTILNPRRIANGSIASLPNLCTTLGLSASHLRRMLAADSDDWYSEKQIPKNDGTIRIVHRPCALLRLIQRRINSRILASKGVIVWPDHLYGSLANQVVDNKVVSKDYVACAAVHCGARSIYKLDIKDFYNNVHDDVVYDIFSRLMSYPNNVSSVLTRLCTWNGSLVQGALTSSYLANLCLHDLEGAVVKQLSRKSLVYTRLVDDITVSSKAPDFDFAFAEDLLTTMLVRKGLPVNRAKTGPKYHSSEPLSVHGLRIAFSSPRLPEDEPRLIRSAVRHIEMLSQEGSYRQTHSYRHDFNRCMGRVNKLKRVGHTQHKKLMNRLKKILPLPSPKDLFRAKKAAEKLELEYIVRAESYGYRKRFYILQERLNVLARVYSIEARDIRRSVSNLKPRYAK